MKKHNIFPLLTAAVLACVMAFTLTACGGGKASKDTLRFVGQDYPGGNLNPSYMDNSGWQLIRLGIGETLFKFNKDSDVVPWLAKSYKTNADQSEWVITLNKNIQFSNDKKLTASGAKASIERMYANEKAKKGTASPSTYLTYKSITADDAAGTITITTDASKYINVPAALCNPCFVIIDTTAKTDVSKKPICTGPYAVSSIQPKKRYNLVKNKHYWNGKVPYEKVVFTCSEDASAKALALQNGDQDIAENVTSATDLKTLKEKGDFHVKEVQGTRTALTFMNMRSGRPLANKALRRAINTAMDDKTMCNKTVGGLYAPGVGVLPTSLDYGSSDVKDTTSYSIKKAKAILDAAGIKDTDKDGWRELDGKNIALTYLTYTNRNLHEFAEAQAESMKKIGIKVTVKKTDSDTQWNKLVAGDFDLGNQNWNVMQSGDPQGFMENFKTDGENNYGKYSNSEYDSLYAKLQTTKDTAARKQLFTQLQQILEDDAAIIVNGYYKSNICWSKDVTGVTYQSMDYYWITNKIKPAS